jgi:hypothetical protein
MPTTLTLARGLNIPLNAITQKIAFLARTGAGKTYAAGRMVEQMLTAGAQVIVVDPVGVWYGLRLKADGKRPAYNIPILGGEHGDIQLEASAGSLIADVAVQRGQSMVLDVSTMRKAQATTFVTDFAEQFFHQKKSKKSPVHVVFEEAQRFVPQFVKGKERLVGAVEDIVKVGRNYGIGTTLISQRPQAINKDVLNQTEMLVVLQISGPQERRAIKDWINEKGADESPLDELDELEVGDAVVWSPSWLRILKTVHISKKVTYDASATPDFDTMSYVEPKPLSAHDLQKLEDAMGDMVDAQKARDPRHLQLALMALGTENAQLKAQLKKPQPITTKTVKVPAVTDKQLDRIMHFVERLETVGAKASNAALTLSTTLRQVREAKERPPANVTVQTGPDVIPDTVKVSVTPLKQHVARPVSGGLRKGARKMLSYLLAFQAWGLTKKQLATVVGMSYKSGTFNQYLAALKKDDFIRVQGDRFHITHAGENWADHPVSPPHNTRSMLDLWMPKMRAGARAILQLIVDDDRHLTKEQIAEQLDMSYKSGTFNQYLALLKSCDLVTVDAGLFRPTPLARGVTVKTF